MSMRPKARIAGATLTAILAGLMTGCISMAEFRKLEYEVNKMKRSDRGAAASDGVADLRAEVESLRAELAILSGRVEVAEHETRKALQEAEAARLAGARAATASDPTDLESALPEESEEPPSGASSQELAAYRVAYDAWRTDDNDECIDRFSGFLQSYPASQYADDASYWLADCHYKNGDYKNALLRFDDVASRHPGSDKAPEALYRQGEALLQLGPSFSKAAEGAFQKILSDYPDSRRARQAADQLELLGSSR